MKVAIVTVGSELLDGRVADTNAQWIGGELARRGIEAVMAVTVDDEAGSIVDALDIARERAEVVWVTGGMGATRDDLTTGAVARFLGRDLVDDPEGIARIRGICLRRGIDASAGQMLQARVPRDARAVPNPEGLASGFMVDAGETLWIVLPGVPVEMKSMAGMTVLPELEKRSGTHSATIDLNMAGIPESAVDREVRDIWDALGEGEKFALQVRYGEVRLRISVRGTGVQSARARMEELEAAVRSRIGGFICGTGEEGIADSVIAILREKGATLVTAESLTGGMVSSSLVSVAGASEVLLGGWVAYTEGMKERFLGVSPGTIKLSGVVSRETALEMARGARERAGADYAVSTTGWAGPGTVTNADLPRDTGTWSGPSGADPVGTVYIAVSSKSGAWAERFCFRGSRNTVREFAANAALVFLRRVVSGAGI